MVKGNLEIITFEADSEKALNKLIKDFRTENPNATFYSKTHVTQYFGGEDHTADIFYRSE